MSFFLLIFFDFLWSRFSIEYFGFKLPISYLWPIWLVFNSAFIFSISVKTYISRNYVYSFIATNIFMFVILLILMIRFSFPAMYLIFNVLYFFGFLVLLIGLSDQKILKIYSSSYSKADSFLLKIFWLITICAIFLGIAQFILQDPILDTEIGFGSEMNVLIFEQHATGLIRSFSIFGSALDFGILIIIFSCWLQGWSLLRSSKNFYWTTYFLVFLIGILLCYITQTRNIYFGYIISSFFIILFLKSKVLKLSLFKIFFVNFIFYLMIFFNPLHSFIGEGFFDNHSILLRMANLTSFYVRYIQEAEITNFLFGHGVVQKDDNLLYDRIVIDNTWLDVYLFSGFIGAVFFSIVLTKIFRNQIDFCYESKNKGEINNFDVMIVGMISSYLFVSLINIYVVKFFVILMFLIVCRNLKRYSN